MWHRVFLGGHRHLVEADVLAGFHVASLSLQSQLNQKASGAFCCSQSISMTFTNFSQNTDPKEAVSAWGFHVQYSFLLLYKEPEIINWKKIKKH